MFQRKTLQRRNLKGLNLNLHADMSSNGQLQEKTEAHQEHSRIEGHVMSNINAIKNSSNLFLRRGLKKKLTLNANADEQAELKPSSVVVQRPQNESVLVMSSLSQSPCVSSSSSLSTPCIIDAYSNNFGLSPSSTNSTTSTIQGSSNAATPVENEHSISLPPLEESLSPTTADLKDTLSGNSSDNYIQLQDLVQLGKIGAGNSGTVVKALHVPDSKIVAKKTIPVEQNNSTIINQLVRELSIVKNVKPHENIITFYGAYYNQHINNEIIILMEYSDCGSLDKILSVYKRFVQRETISNKKTWFNELTISKIACGVLNGLDHLYRQYKIIHRDIKPSNVLINSKGQIKLCDFGVSKKLINSIADTFVGTSTYMSPERIQGNVYSIKGDVWSLGLMIIELVTGEFPLGGHNDTPDGILDLLQRIVNEPSPRLPKGRVFSKELTDFVNRCCIKNERERSSINELLHHDLIMKYSSPSKDEKFRHWCKKIKSKIKEDKRIKREALDRAKLETKANRKSNDLNASTKTS
ncbi:mitogen-activated protein kinase kinase STE7 SKDI_04G0860 [Saccharomyces kudriavzevii IFO 1802]|uniref:mitogen-activated protein kinase kinase n=1 Tax=Saccharomyces kudriavzevii (strain ATCC MYA-4449 / AS 2.2408 / CBS 8840 / NBRC 1802 / NCYC 2889) TaxID=226230 RepID=A0AA35JEL0_SACK1|nr:uncharacterized protein SKDI_04G0860 [Saccharomyces kudriavzevii IFO 1802]CAI4057283.1 hypothetical protein SKDI_04G0860 [Saccharomyces kudriavzevii IFO 1802]